MPNSAATDMFFLYRIVSGKRPWVLAVQPPNIGGGRLPGGDA